MKHIMIRNNLWEGKKDNLSRQLSMKNDDIKYSDPQNLETMKFKIIDNCQAIARTLT